MCLLKEAPKNAWEDSENLSNILKIAKKAGLDPSNNLDKNNDESNIKIALLWKQENASFVPNSESLDDLIANFYSFYSSTLTLYENFDKIPIPDKKTNKIALDVITSSAHSEAVAKASSLSPNPPIEKVPENLNELEEGRKKLNEMNKSIFPLVSRESGRQILRENPDLKFVAWESASKPENFGIWEQGNDTLYIATPHEFLKYMQKMETPPSAPSTGSNPSNVQTSIPLQTEAPVASKTPSLELNTQAMFLDLEKRTKTGEVLNNSQVVNSFVDPQCMCLKKGAVELGNDRFLHANRVTYEDDGYTHIAAQAPQSPVARERFWKTAFTTPGNLIVDLTNAGDLKNSSELGLNYPKLGETETFGSMQIKCKASEEEKDITTSTYEVQQLNSEGQPLGKSQTVTRINYKLWKDFSGADAHGLKKLISLVDSRAPKDIVPIVHCRAGVGRTGTFITARTIEHLSKELNDQGIYKINKDNLKEQMENIVLNGRESRGPWFVQNEKQMETLIVFAKNAVKIKNAKKIPPITA